MVARTLIVCQGSQRLGFQISLYGLAGILLAAEEGLEVNVLGLNVGLDAAVPALKLPAIGRLGLDR